MENKISKAETLWQNSKTKPDKLNTWGFYSYGDASPAIGGGIGSFAWFSTREELFSFIRDVLPYSPPGSSDADWSKVEKDVDEIVKQSMEDKVNDQVAVESLNNALITFSQIEWLGTFQDLILNNHPFAKRVRQEFWELEDEDNNTGHLTISDNEIESFRDFLGDYGI